MIKKILSNSFLYFITTALIKVSMLIISIFVSRLTNKEIFGQYMLIRNSISTFELIALFGMNQTSIKYVAENNNTHKTSNLEIALTNIFYISFLSAVFFSSIVFLYSENISMYFFNSNNTEVIISIKYSSIILFFSIFSVILSSILNGFEEYKVLAITNLLSTTIFIIPTFYLIYNFQLIGSILGVAIFFILSSTLKFYKIYVHIKELSIKINFRININQLLQILKFTFPIFLSVILILPVFWYSKTLLMNYNQNGFNEIAIFEASYQWLTIILVITGAVTNISLALFSKIVNNYDLKKALIINLCVNIFISLFLSLIFIYFGDYLLLIYGKGYNNPELLQILLLSSIPFTAYSILNRFFISIDKIWYNFFLSISWSIIFLGYIYLDISNINALIIAKSFLISYSILFLISLFFLYIARKDSPKRIKIV